MLPINPLFTLAYKFLFKNIQETQETQDTQDTQDTQETEDTSKDFFEGFKKHGGWIQRDNERFENRNACLKAANYIIKNKLEDEVENLLIYLKLYIQRSVAKNEFTIKDFHEVAIKLVENNLISSEKALHAVRELSPTTLSLETSSPPITTRHSLPPVISSLVTNTLTAIFPPVTFHEDRCNTGQIKISTSVTSTEPDPSNPSATQISTLTRQFLSTLPPENARNEIMQKIRDNKAPKKCMQDLVRLYAHSPEDRLRYLNEFKPHGTYNGAGNPYSNHSFNPHSNSSYQGRYKYTIDKETFNDLLKSTRSDRYVIATDLVRFIKDGKPFAIQLVEQLLKEKSPNTLENAHYLLRSSPLNGTDMEEMSALIVDYFNILFEDDTAPNDQEKLYSICLKYYEIFQNFSRCEMIKPALLKIANRILQAGDEYKKTNHLGLKIYLKDIKTKRDELDKKLESKE